MSRKAENSMSWTMEDTMHINQLRPYLNNPFSIPKGLLFDEIVASIKENGVIHQILVRPTDSEGENGKEIYEIISGHVRVEAAKVAGLDEIPCKIRTMSDDEAAVMVVEANYSRDYSTPSELGKAFKLRLDALNRQGQRAEVSSNQYKQKSSREEIASVFNISASKVFRYTRLAYLIPQFQIAVDDKKMTLTVAEDISYLAESEQHLLNELLIGKNLKLSKNFSTKLKKMKFRELEVSPTSELSEAQISSILEEGKTHIHSVNKERPVSNKAFVEAISSHKKFEGMDFTNDKILETIIKALDAFEE